MTYCLFRSKITTPIGEMTALYDDRLLYLLSFEKGEALKRKIDKLLKILKADIDNQEGPFIAGLKEELESYFSGGLKVFKTPVHMLGTDFQKKAWSALQTIEYGKMASYRDQAGMLSIDQGSRAIGNANAANNIAIIIPCHRVIRSDGSFGGYAGGADLKQKLLALEAR